MKPQACSEEVGALILEMALLVAKRAFRRGMIPSREIDEARGVAVVRMVAGVGRFDPARGKLEPYLKLIAWCGIRDHVRWLKGRGTTISARVEGCDIENESRRRCCTFCPFEDPSFERDREVRAASNAVDSVMAALPVLHAAACHQLLAECRGVSDVHPMSSSKKSRIRGACATLFLRRRTDSSPSGTDQESRTYST